MLPFTQDFFDSAASAAAAAQGAHKGVLGKKGLWVIENESKMKIGEKRIKIASDSLNW